MSSYGDRTTIKNLLGLTYNDFGLVNNAGYNTLIDSIIEDISGTINGHCNRDFDLHEEDEVKLRGTNDYYLIAPFGPIISIDSIEINDSVVDTDDYQIVRGKNTTRNGYAIERFNSWWARSTHITLTYDWGFSTPPPAVVRVCENLCIHELRGLARRRKTGDVDSVSMGGYSVSYSSSDKIYEAELRKLQPYRSIIIG